MKDGKKLVICLLLVIVVTGAWAYQFIHSRWNRASDVIRVSGNIEVTEAQASFRIAGRVQERLVSEGETIKVGQIIARLDNTELAQEVSLRRAEVEAAQAALAELLAGSRVEEIGQAEASFQRAQSRLNELLAGSRSQEIAAAEAEVRRAKAETERLRLEEERARKLYNGGFISDQEHDLARTNYEVAQARQKETEENLKLVKEGPRKEEIEQARAALREAKERLILVRKGPRSETIDQARARLKQAAKSLSLAETRLGYATLVSPLSGVVLSKNVEPGEYVAPGTPVVTVGDLEDVWLRAYINETDLGRVKVGQGARVTTDSYPGKIYEGKISFIASEAEFTPKNVQTEKERVKLVYRVKVDIRNPNMELKPGMPADGEIMVGESR